MASFKVLLPGWAEGNKYKPENTNLRAISRCEDMKWTAVAQGMIQC
jgi:hypothetical protein